MAGLKKRGDVYYIRFSRTRNGKTKRKTLSLGTTLKREAEKLRIQFEDMYQRGEIDPFNGWTPQKEAEKKREKLKGKYVPLHKAADQFIEQRSQANATTKKNYRKHLDMLIDQLGHTMPVTDIYESDIREFCFRPDLAPATQASYLRHLKVFFNWLHKRDITKENIVENIKPPRVPQKISQKTITREQLDKVFEAFDKFYEKQEKIRYVTKPHQKRLWFKPLINTAYYCGLRPKETVNLTWQDVVFSESDDPESFGHVRIVNTNTNTTKSAKERQIPIREPLYKWLYQWYKDQGEPTDGYVFPSATGLHEWHKMDPAALSKSFKKFVRLATDVPNTITLHGLRHSCATDLIIKGVSPVIVQKVMGHASLETTMIYVHLVAKDVEEALKGID